MTVDSWIQGYPPDVKMTERIMVPITKEDAKEIVRMVAARTIAEPKVLRSVINAILAKWPDLK